MVIVASEQYVIRSPLFSITLPSFLFTLDHPTLSCVVYFAVDFIPLSFFHPLFLWSTLSNLRALKSKLLFCA